MQFQAAGYKQIQREKCFKVQNKWHNGIKTHIRTFNIKHLVYGRKWIVL